MFTHYHTGGWLGGGGCGGGQRGVWIHRLSCASHHIIIIVAMRITHREELPQNSNTCRTLPAPALGFTRMLPVGRRAESVKRVIKEFNHMLVHKSGKEAQIDFVFTRFKLQNSRTDCPIICSILSRDNLTKGCLSIRISNSCSSQSCSLTFFHAHFIWYLHLIVRCARKCHPLIGYIYIASIITDSLSQS